jgi:hypothetical protein
VGEEGRAVAEHARQLLAGRQVPVDRRERGDQRGDRGLVVAELVRDDPADRLEPGLPDRPGVGQQRPDRGELPLRLLQLAGVEARGRDQRAGEDRVVAVQRAPDGLPSGIDLGARVGDPSLPSPACSHGEPVGNPGAAWGAPHAHHLGRRV